MQTQKSPNDPHITIRACGCKFHHYQPIHHFKILLDINVHWNRRPLTIWRFFWQPFWKWWPRKNVPECKFLHYQSIPHFKILLDINFHWNRRPLTICRFCWRPFWKRWHRKNDPECNFHHYQSISHFKITLDINMGENILPTLLNINAKSCGNPFGSFRYKWGQKFWHMFTVSMATAAMMAPLEMGIHLPVKFSKDWIISLWEFGRTSSRREEEKE